MNTVIYMIRHAHSPYTHGEERTRGLSDAGEECAKRIPQLLKDTDIHCIISSPYERAVRTVHHLAEHKGLPIRTYEELMERSIVGLNINSDWEIVKQAIQQSFMDLDYALEGGETTRQVQARAIPVIEQLLKEFNGKTIAIGTHGNIMTCMINYFDNSYGYEFWSSISMPDIYKLTFQDMKLLQVERLWDSE